jgi:hypothetical protein
MRAIAIAAALLVLAPAGSAANGLLVVDPGHPVVGKRALIEVRTKAKGPLSLRLTSPTGVHLRVRLVRAKPGVWRVGYHFVDDGQWTLRVPQARAAATVLVFQPGGAVPPFKPNANNAASVAAGGVVIGR